jgi:hypothetical protein
MKIQRRPRLAALAAAAVGTAAAVTTAATLIPGRTVAAGAGSLQPVHLAATAQQSQNKPITVGGVTYPSVRAFIEGGHVCGTRNPTPGEIQTVESRLKAFQAKNGLSNSGSATAAPAARSAALVAATPGSIVVPVYVHVVTTSNGTGDVSDDRIKAQLDVLNRAYAGQDMMRVPGQGPSQSPTARMPFRFVLQKVDRTVNDTWYYYALPFFPDVEAEMKSALRQGGPNALNVYTTDLLTALPFFGLLGYATFPSDYPRSPKLDGVVIDNSTTPGGNQGVYSLGDVLVHESGHWVGLYHTFQDNGFDGCNSFNDGVADTPAERGPFANGDVPPYTDTCKTAPFPGRDPAENFMDYSFPSSMFQFTPGQASRAYAFWLQYRKP